MAINVDKAIVEEAMATLASLTSGELMEKFAPLAKITQITEGTEVGAELFERCKTMQQHYNAAFVEGTQNVVKTMTSVVDLTDAMKRAAQSINDVKVITADTADIKELIVPRSL